MNSQTTVAMTAHQVFNFLSMVMKIEIRSASEGRLRWMANNNFHSETQGDHNILADVQDMINAEFKHISSTGHFSPPVELVA